MRDSGNRPHVSLAIYRELDVAVCASLLTSFAHMHAPFSLTFESLGIFHAEKTVVFLAPIVSSHLLMCTGRYTSCCRVQVHTLRSITSLGIGLLTVHLLHEYPLISSLK